MVRAGLAFHWLAANATPVPPVALAAQELSGSSDIGITTVTQTIVSAANQRRAGRIACITDCRAG